MKVLTKSQLSGLWSSGKPIERKGVSYFCNRNCGGLYYFEPLPIRGEREGFAPGTIWIGKRFIKNK